MVNWSLGLPFHSENNGPFFLIKKSSCRFLFKNASICKCVRLSVQFKFVAELPKNRQFSAFSLSFQFSSYFL